MGNKWNRKIDLPNFDDEMKNEKRRKCFIGYKHDI